MHYPSALVLNTNNQLAAESFLDQFVNYALLSSPDVILSVVLRTLIVTFLVLAIIRWLGNKGVGQLNSFELLIIIGLGAIIGDPMIYTKEISIPQAISAVIIVVVLFKGIDYLTARSKGNIKIPVQEFNKGNINFLMSLYENNACFAPRPGQVDRDLESIRRSFQGLIDMGAKLDAKAQSIIYASNLALLITKWSISGTETNGNSINLTGRGTVVFRQQPDGNWLIVIENPWGTQ